MITANQAPDHATIARFRVRHEEAIAGLFGEVLALCARSGLVKVGVVAVDGTKIAAAATHHATRSYEQIAREILEEAARIDAAEDELYGEARGDELPEGLRTSGDRRQVLREAKQALDAERAAQAKKSRVDRGERLVECRRRLRQDWELERHVVTEHAAWHAAGIASDGSRRMVGARHNIKPYPLRTAPAGKINVTDPDSRNLKTTRGWVQGYNAQAVVGEGQIVLAAEISTESLDTANLQPMVETAIGELEARGRRSRRPGVVLADAGYWKNERDRGALRPRASRRSSRPTPTAAKSRGPAGAAASMTSRAASWRPTGATSSTSGAKERSSPSSARSSPTAAPTASCAAAGLPSDPNGGCSRRRTTCSSSTATSSQPPDLKAGRADADAITSAPFRLDPGSHQVAARESSRRPCLTPGFITKPANATDLCATPSAKCGSQQSAWLLWSTPSSRDAPPVAANRKGIAARRPRRQRGSTGVASTQARHHAAQTDAEAGVSLPRARTELGAPGRKRPSRSRRRG